ncbi:sulfotransferase family protein [Methylomonas rivi]|uniref:Sulfotransferase n=1 Tax=Methylomonas rivi TaxID=2952226 RepID=A0ABT1U3D0_9GAMM|nr:sulfotransferase [Methylomonas sp. WSC-6]
MNTDVRIADSQQQNIKNTLVITGAPRSGTSLLGKLISTLDGIDYHFEPPMVWVLASLLSMKALSPDVASVLLRLHLHEDLLLESAHGRKANLRPGDDSLVLNSMHWPELLSRWQTIRNRDDAIRYVSERQLRLAFKTPSVIDAIPFFESALPECKFIIIMRDGRDVVKSILQKRWFSDEGMKDNYWPYKVVDGVSTTHLVEDSMVGQWATMNEATRACYLWRRDAEFALEAKKRGLGDRLYMLSYEALRLDPTGMMEQIAKFLSTTTTDLTKLSTLSVRPMAENPLSGKRYDFLNDVDVGELKKFNELNSAWGYA